MRTVDNLVVHELIGLDVKVIKSRSLAYLGLAGKVIDETKDRLIIMTDKGRKSVPKTACVFRFKLGDKTVDVDGRLIAYRPEDRPKQLMYLVKKRKVYKEESE